MWLVLNSLLMINQNINNLKKNKHCVFVQLKNRTELKLVSVFALLFICKAPAELLSQEEKQRRPSWLTVPVQQ